MNSPEDDVLDVICDRVRALTVALDEDMRLLGPVPSNIAAFEALSEHSRVGARALLKSVEQLEDQLTRLFRTILASRDVDLKGLYARDVANQMEALGIVIDADAWMGVVKLRNRLVHDYPLTSIARFAKLIEAVAATQVLRGVSARALTYIYNEEGSV